MLVIKISPEFYHRRLTAPSRNHRTMHGAGFNTHPS